MNTGLAGILNEICIRKIIKIHSSPQTAILARINTGIAEMLFRRVDTPKGIETVFSHKYVFFHFSLEG